MTRREADGMSARKIQEVVEENTGRWMGIPGVVGTAVGQFEGRPCIKLFVAEKTGELASKFPAAVEGHRVIVEETGPFRAL